jgi:hypothetical protein
MKRVKVMNDINHDILKWVLSAVSASVALGFVILLETF